MKQPNEIRNAYRMLSEAAKYASRTGDNESYEVLANCAMAIGWVIEPNGGNSDVAFVELMKGAKWAATGGEERN